MQSTSKRLFPLILSAVFAALIAVGAFIRIPTPLVPVTMQLLFTTLAGLLLGGRYGALSAALYLVLGLVGVPIFTEGGGFGYVFKPSFGYIIGFVAGAYVTGWIANRVEAPSDKRLLAANFAGMAIVYAVGFVYYYLLCNYVIHTPVGLWPLFLSAVVMVAPGDIVMSILSAVLAKRLIPILHRMGIGAEEKRTAAQLK